MSNFHLAPTTSDVSLAKLLFKILSFPTSKAFLSFLCETKNGRDKPTPHQRQSLCVLAGMEQDWVQCDQKIVNNVEHLAAVLCEELYDTYQFYIQTLIDAIDINHENATEPLTWFKKEKFWDDWGDIKSYSWLPARTSTYDAVVHFLQAGSGTGVHIGDGVIITCAHVIEAGGDPGEGDNCQHMPNRIGRVKAVMFPSGQMFFAQCVAVTESLDGTSDTAALQITTAVTPEPNTPSSFLSLPFATLATEPPAVQTDLLCIGNPSQTDLEWFTSDKNEFTPATWHSSVGRVQTSKEGERGAGTLLRHSCWTYWGHSGAPLFNRSGEVVGLHCSWDEDSGVRQGQRLETVLQTLDKLYRKPSCVWTKKRKLEVAEVIDLT